MSTQPQPAPVLAWHIETGREIDALYVKANMGRCTEWPAFDTIPPIIAAHDPHAETVRLLEEAGKRIGSMTPSSNDEIHIPADCHPASRLLVQQIRAHLAKLKGTQ